mgnify:FL=1
MSDYKILTNDQVAFLKRELREQEPDEDIHDDEVEMFAIGFDNFLDECDNKGSFMISNNHVMWISFNIYCRGFVDGMCSAADVTDEVLH